MQKLAVPRVDSHVPVPDSSLEENQITRAQGSSRHRRTELHLLCGGSWEVNTKAARKSYRGESRTIDAALVDTPKPITGPAPFGMLREEQVCDRIGMG